MNQNVHLPDYLSPQLFSYGCIWGSQPCIHLCLHHLPKACTT